LICQRWEHSRIDVIVSNRQVRMSVGDEVLQEAHIGNGKLSGLSSGLQICQLI
jgi:hypothetical protein